MSTISEEMALKQMLRPNFRGSPSYLLQAVCLWIVRYSGIVSNPYFIYGYGEINTIANTITNMNLSVTNWV